MPRGGEGERVHEEEDRMREGRGVQRKGESKRD